MNKITIEDRNGKEKEGSTEVLTMDGMKLGELGKVKSGIFCGDIVRRVSVPHTFIIENLSKNNALNHWYDGDDMEIEIELLPDAEIKVII